ncbi:Ornithine decarboxylase [Dipsacomyces acuminosporus]|nr:Ornithine decarboxylase [Dipsacomyces acuminosporus]
MHFIDSIVPSAATTAISTEVPGRYAPDQLHEMPSKLKSGHAVEAALPRISHGSVQDAMRAKLSQPDAEDAFFVADIGEVYRQFMQWTQHLPRVQPFYAVKCNPDPLVVKLLASLGAGFDCASKAEIQQALHEGAGSQNIIYAHPCKPASHLRYAKASGVAMMTFDNADELHKIKQLYPEAKAVLRILTDDSNSLCQLGLKFGAALDTTHSLLLTAKKLGINVVGVSFHVGSGCQSEAAFADAVMRARQVFDQASKLGFDGLSFTTVARVLSEAIDLYFPAERFAHVRLIAEPGRYFVASAFSLAVNVIARRQVVRDRQPEYYQDDEGVMNNTAPTHDENPAFMYYVNDGVYGSFNCIMFDHQHPQPRVLTCNGQFASANAARVSENQPMMYESSVWGPTCDSIDCIMPSGMLPELQIGDWLVFDGMGAYTLCAASRFNGFKLSDLVYVDTEGVLL